MTVRNSSRPIARVFRATAAPGCRDDLLQRFHSSSAALVNSKEGCLKYRILEPVDASAPEVVFESIWRDLDAVKMTFGDAWQQSHLAEGYSALMTAYSVHHFLVSEERAASQLRQRQRRSRAPGQRERNSHDPEERPPPQAGSAVGAIVSGDLVITPPSANRIAGQ
jgi:quinol monooxygenase YgiN